MKPQRTHNRKVDLQPRLILSTPKWQEVMCTSSCAKLSLVRPGGVNPRTNVEAWMLMAVGFPRQVVITSSLLVRFKNSNVFKNFIFFLNNKKLLRFKNYKDFTL